MAEAAPLMVYGLLTVAAIIFYEAFVRLRTAAVLRVLLTEGPAAMRTIASPMSDDEKERLLRHASRRVGFATAALVLKLVLAAVATGLVLWAGAQLLSIPLEEVESGMLSPLVIVVLVIVTLAYARIRHVRH